MFKYVYDAHERYSVIHQRGTIEFELFRFLIFLAVSFEVTAEYIY